MSFLRWLLWGFSALRRKGEPAVYSYTNVRDIVETTIRHRQGMGFCYPSYLAHAIATELSGKRMSTHDFVSYVEKRLTAAEYCEPNCYGAHVIQ